MQAAVTASPRYPKYAEAIDRESAREKLAAKLEAGAQKAETEPKAKSSAKKSASQPKEKKKQESMVTQVVQSSAFKDFMRTAAREVARGMFNTARR
jgi:hypothetical protein